MVTGVGQILTTANGRRWRRSLGALAIIVIVVIGVWLFNLSRGDGLSEDERVGRAAVGQNDALQRENFTDFRAYTCRAQQGSEADILARQRDSVAKRGARYVDDVTDVVIDGDSATAKVIYHFDKDVGHQSRCRDDVCARGRSMEGLFDRPQLGVGHSRP